MATLYDQLAPIYFRVYIRITYIRDFILLIINCFKLNYNLTLTTNLKTSTKSSSRNKIRIMNQFGSRMKEDAIWEQIRSVNSGTSQHIFEQVIFCTIFLSHQFFKFLKF